MGVRKRQMAERLKAEKAELAFAKLNNCPTSPRKMRLVADQPGVDLEAQSGDDQVLVEHGSLQPLPDAPDPGLRGARLVCCGIKSNQRGTDRNLRDRGHAGDCFDHAVSRARPPDL